MRHRTCRSLLGKGEAIDHDVVLTRCRADNAGIHENWKVLFMANVINVASRTAMSAIASPVAGNTLFLNEDGREGLFECIAGAPPADPMQGLYVQSGTSGFYYARVWDGVHGRPEWFGAKTNDPAQDTYPAIHACEALCPVIVYSVADYYSPSTFVFSVPTRLHLGVAGEGTASGGGTRLMMRPPAGATAAQLTAPVAHIGPISDPMSSNGYAGRLDGSGISFFRDRTNGNPPADSAGRPENSVIGVRYRWITDCRWEQCNSIDSPVAHDFRACIDTHIARCGAYRGYVSLGSNDLYVGFQAGGDLPALTTVIGGNASLYIEECKVGAATAIGVPYSAGARFWGYMADQFLRTSFETVGVGRGIDLVGSKSDGTAITISTDSGKGAFAHQNVEIDKVVADLVGVAGIYVKGLNVGGIVTIGTIDAAPNASNSAAIVLDNCHANLVVAPSRVPAVLNAGALVADGLRAVNSSSFDVFGLIIKDGYRPLYLQNCYNFHVNLRSYRTVANSSVAAQVTGCSRGTVNIAVDGIDQSYTGGVAIDSTTALVEFNGSRINPGCFIGYSSNPSAAVAKKVTFNGVDARTSSAFSGTQGNVLSGTTA